MNCGFSGSGKTYALLSVMDQFLKSCSDRADRKEVVCADAIYVTFNTGCDLPETVAGEVGDSFLLDEIARRVRYMRHGAFCPPLRGERPLQRFAAGDFDDLVRSWKKDVEASRDEPAAQDVPGSRTHLLIVVDEVGLCLNKLARGSRATQLQYFYAAVDTLRAGGIWLDVAISVYGDDAPLRLATISRRPIVTLSLDRVDLAATNVDESAISVVSPARYTHIYLNKLLVGPHRKALCLSQEGRALLAELTAFAWECEGHPRTVETFVGECRSVFTQGFIENADPTTLSLATEAVKEAARLSRSRNAVERIDRGLPLEWLHGVLRPIPDSDLSAAFGEFGPAHLAAVGGTLVPSLESGAAMIYLPTAAANVLGWPNVAEGGQVLKTFRSAMDAREAYGAVLTEAEGTVAVIRQSAASAFEDLVGATFAAIAAAAALRRADQSALLFHLGYATGAPGAPVQLCGLDGNLLIGQTRKMYPLSGSDPTSLFYIDGSSEIEVARTSACVFPKLPDSNPACDSVARLPLRVGRGKPALTELFIQTKHSCDDPRTLLAWHMRGAAVPSSGAWVAWLDGVVSIHSRCLLKDALPRIFVLAIAHRWSLKRLLGDSVATPETLVGACDAYILRGLQSAGIKDRGVPKIAILDADALGSLCPTILMGARALAR
jgi:hypothetical protein